MASGLKRIHINKNVIRFNEKYGNKLPACRTELVDEKKTVYSKEVWIWGPSKLVYSPTCPLKCGAKLWIETYDNVEFVEPVEYSTIRKEMEEIREDRK